MAVYKPAIQNVIDELNRTAVISEDFKQHLISLTLEAYRAGYWAGKKEDDGA